MQGGNQDRILERLTEALIKSANEGGVAQPPQKERTNNEEVIRGALKWRKQLSLMLSQGEWQLGWK